jgi:Domain of unknown function (DUF4436)
MPITKRLTTRDMIVGVGLIVVFAIAMWLVLNSYQREGEKRSAEISSEGEKDPNHIEAFVKLLTVDPVKGDATARIEFVPHGSFAKEDGTLTRNLKLYTNSATGKQEHDFQKGKRMNPVEAVVNMYDGLVTDYPFDHHSAFLELYLVAPEAATGQTQSSSSSTASGGAAAERTETPAATPPADTPPAPAATPATTEDKAQPSPTPKKAENTAATAEEEVSIAVDFYGSIAGYRIEAAKSEDSDDDYVGIDMKIARSSTVVFFSMFVMILMWGVTIAVLLLTLSILLRGRKVELAMFSFLAALLFAFAAVRNSQPGVPPIGTYSDFIAFFWAEVLLALCLLAIIFIWLFRPAAK